MRGVGRMRLCMSLKYQISNQEIGSVGVEDVKDCETRLKIDGQNLYANRDYQDDRKITSEKQQVRKFTIFHRTEYD